ncbi:hypothetical protein Btru_032552 [Bulinus truncatus]|nr:hypothetical protein Btru_032552 [Bulinus truncatus]
MIISISRSSNIVGAAIKRCYVLLGSLFISRKEIQYAFYCFTAMLSSQHPPLPPQHSFHRNHRVAPGVSQSRNMRELDVDEGEGYIGDGAHRKPSRLEQMRADYQKMMMKKKEEKMLQVYEEGQKKMLMRMNRAGSGGGQNRLSSPQGNVREFFNERRKMASSGKPVPPVENHYLQMKGQPSSPADWSSRTGSGSSVKTQRSSAGRDRAHPLVPIQRPPDNQDAGNQNGRSGIPLRRHTNDNAELNPFDTKPRMVKHLPLPGKNYQVDNNNNGGTKGTGMTKLSSGSRTQSQPNLAKSPQINHKIAQLSDDPIVGGSGKLTDFQKWQLEQAKAREKRLRKVNHRQHEDEEDGVWPDPEEDPRFAQEPEEISEHEPESSTPNSRIKELERQLMEKIAKEQSELKRIQMERKKEEEEEKREAERQKKKEAAERARFKKLEEERRKEEERRRVKEEEEERAEREREERRRITEEQQQSRERASKQEERNKLKTVDKRVKEEMTYDSEEDDGGYQHVQPHPPKKVNSPAKRFEPKATRSKASVYEDDEEAPVANSDANYYLQAAASSEAKGSVGYLEKCSLCGRSFAPDRLGKHEQACRKANKPRKEFDSSKKRVEGTELAKYADKARRPEPQKKKSNWRAQHQNFIDSLRYAKKVTQIEKEGGDLRSLAPPPRTIDPNLIPCPHCGRKFNETAAERHIPRCKDLKTRPPPMNTRRK